MNHKLTLLALAVIISAPASVFAGTLHDAICGGDLPAVKRLLPNAGSINKEQDGQYPLSLAAYCYGGQPTIVEYLLDRGANVNLYKAGDYSPLMWAIRSMREGPSNPMRKAALRMVRMGADAKFKNASTGQSALMWAAGHGDSELVDLLLSKGADKSARDQGWCISGENQKCNAADYARVGGFVELALKLEGKNPAEYRKTIHYAAKQGDLSALQRLIEGGADLNAQETLSKLTALHYAVEYDRKEITQALLRARANPNLRNFAGTTPLREAVVKRNEAMSRLLIDAGAHANNEQTQGCGGGLTEFGWAIEYGQHGLARYMIEKRAVDPANPGKAFVSMYGRHDEEVGLAQYLIDQGGKPVQSDVDTLRKTEEANTWLKEKGTTAKIIALLEKAMSNPVTPDQPVPPDLKPDMPDVSTDLPEPPDFEEIAGMRSRGGAPASYRTRSLKKEDPGVRNFDLRFRTGQGALSPDPMRSKP